MTTTNDARRRGRYEREAEAVAAFERMADTIGRSGLR
jgi:hypothetical protein